MGGFNGTNPWLPTTTTSQLGAQTRTTKTVTTEREFDEERLVKETITETTETVTDHGSGYPHYTYTTNVAGTQ